MLKIKYTPKIGDKLLVNSLNGKEKLYTKKYKIIAINKKIKTIAYDCIKQKDYENAFFINIENYTFPIKSLIWDEKQNCWIHWLHFFYENKSSEQLINLGWKF